MGLSYFYQVYLMVIVQISYGYGYTCGSGRVDQYNRTDINARCHRHNQDFVRGALFFFKKVDDLFSRRPQNTPYKTYLNNPSHRPDLPNFLKN